MEPASNFNQKIDLNQLDWFECECGGRTFTPHLMFKRLSQLLSPTGREETVPVEIFICDNCKKIPGFVHKKIPGIPDNMKASDKISRVI